MLHIILGDDNVESRKKFIGLKEEYKKKQYDIITLNSYTIGEMDKWLYQSIGLFGPKKAFFGENLLSKKENKELLKKYDTSDADINIFIWEESLEDRFIKYIFKNATLHISKLPYTIFKLLDAIYPSNRREALFLLDTISKTINEHMILVMIQKRMRELLLIKSDLKPDKKLADWQIKRLKMHAAKWDEKKLALFYDSLYRVEVFSKTNGRYYSVKKTLDIVLFYFL